MGLLNSLIVILIIKILFLKVDIWHVNAIQFIDPLLLEVAQLKLERDDAVETFNDTKCSELISRKIPQYIPYTETYRYRPMPTHSYPWSPIYQIKTRLNFKRQFHIMWTCCEGYVQSGKMCVPRCPRSCEKGTCKEPDVCTCNKGYRMSSEGSCVPECTNGCVNGTCVEPEVCSCNEGYWMDSDGFTCRPVCNEECERNHGYCSEPNVCTCHSGYRKIGNESSPFICEPICNRPCTNGRCAAPNVCTMCSDGYEMSKYKPFTCRPKCDEPCVFGTCTALGTCTCDLGYRAVNASVCEPICSKPCKMSVCMAPEKCSCHEGYKHHNVGSSYECEPICENGCINGVCIAPGLCSCNTGYVYNDTSKTCKPHCMTPCGSHGICTSPNMCTCFKGYQKLYSYIMRRIGSKWFHMIAPTPSTVADLCQPICDFDCINGICTAPNVCTCYPEYYPSWLEFDQPLDNYTQRVCTERTEPPCNAFSCGGNGTCHESGVCICNDGYAKETDGVCVPSCHQGCTNGTCTAPNRCACHDGFAPRNDSFCEPICERGCQNGDCVGPNSCVCHDNFIPNFDHHSRPECIPVCTRNCSGHGECVIDRDNDDDDDYRCECHFGWTGENCDQPTMCVITMAYDHHVSNRVTIRNDTNSTIVRAYENAPNCYQCDNSFDNATLCYTIQSDEDNTTNIGCLLSTDLPCYTTSLYNVSINVTIIPIWLFVILAILLVTGPIVAAYLIYRKRQKKKLATGISTNVFIRESFATECLLPDI